MEGLYLRALHILRGRGVAVPTAQIVLWHIARSGWLRRAFRWLRQPLVAIPIYTLFLYGWHFSIFFEAAVRNPLVHELQHMSFIGIGILVWWSALNPKRRRVHGDLWKIPYLLGARMIGMMLGMSFVIIREREALLTSP